ncbi:hypothetical protein GOQ30_17325 [Flavobacterium sp. TP390]|uniref:Lipocalin-like domain-containing protein n=1 Tax=Flavobacterium profundi TaxID=1774945 RepID=A0A6I4IVM7_9FLAO|nr:hypothetical protein [Flavobacterium profundi]MVO10936.1 hypothetical protein [Flavobacterium profundi]
MKKILFFALFFILTSCSKKISSSDLNFLNGFWEIEKVVKEGETVKEYKINESVERFDFHDDKGTRNKVIMLYNGNFVLNNVVQEFSIEEKEGTFYLLNHTEFSDWKEEIERLDENELVIKNEEGIQYFFKKRTDINLGTNGKEI